MSGWYLSDVAGQNPMLVQVSHVSCKRGKITQFSQDSSQIPDACDLKPFFLILTSALVQDYGF